MKKILTLFACAALLGTACTDDANDDGNRHRTYEVAVQLVYPEGSELTATEGVEVRMTNSSTGTVTTAATDAAGIASFTLTEGIYESTATDRRSVDGYTYTLNALQSNIVISSSTWSEGMTLSRAVRGRSSSRSSTRAAVRRMTDRAPTSSTNTWSSTTTPTRRPASATSVSA